jgi:hypothetical protein
MAFPRDYDDSEFCLTKLFTAIILEKKTFKKSARYFVKPFRKLKITRKLKTNCHFNFPEPI